MLRITKLLPASLFWSLLTLLLPVCAFTQQAAERKAVRFIYKMERHPGFSKPYRKLIYELKDFSSDDSLLAHALIKRLNAKKDAFFVCLRTRLQWAYVERLNKKWLIDAGNSLATDRDSALYLYAAGLYVKDSLLEVISRKMGYVRSITNTKGEYDEVVDWKKMYKMRLNTNPYSIINEWDCGDILFPKKPCVRRYHFSQAINYFQKTSQKAPAEPYYLEEWIRLVAWYAPYEEVNAIIQTILSQHIAMLTPAQQKRIKRLATRIEREHKLYPAKEILTL